MREFIGGAFIVVGLLTIPALVIGLISPKNVSPKGAPPLTRKQITWSMWALFLVCMIAGGVILPEASDKPVLEQEAKKSTKQEITEDASSQPKTDAEVVKTTHDYLATIEDDFIARQKKFEKDMPQIIANKSMSTSQKQTEMASRFTEMLVILDKSGDLEMPTIKSSNAQRHLTEAIDTHKKWAITQQAKINAVMKLDAPTAKAMGEQADRLAMQEALALSMAYKEVGLKIE